MNRLLSAFICSACAGGAFAQDPPLAHFFGFMPPEIYKLDPRVQNLICVDLNADGLTDSVIVNNLRNRLDVLQQLKSGTDESATIGLDVNEIPSANRMKHRKIQMQRPVGGLSIHDINADGRMDLVYVSPEPPSLNVEFQSANGDFGDRRSFEIDEILPREWMHDVGDVNGDGRPDIVFLGRENLYVIEVGDGGRLPEPRKFRLSGSDPGLLRIVDVDEDGRKDIVFITQDPQFPVRLRLQSKDGRLGPEHQIDIERPRSVSWGKIDTANRGTNMLTISDLTGRLMIYRLGEAKPRQGVPTTQFMTYPYERAGTSPNTGITTLDVDGDGKIDVAVSDPNGASILLYRQSESDGLGLGKSYPTMVGAGTLRSLSLGPGKEYLIVHSGNEKAIGICEWNENRLQFPQTLPTKNEPATMAVLGSGDKALVAYVARVEDVNTFTEKFFLRLLKPTKGANGFTFEPVKLAGKDEIDLDLPNKPNDLRVVDANGDGMEDLLVFIPGEDAPKLFLGAKDNGFTSTPRTAQGTLGGVAASSVFFDKLNGDSPQLFVSQNNYIRKMKFENDGRWRVLEQVNAPTSAARILGVAALDFDADGKPELVMYDRTSQSLEVLQQKDGRWERFFQRKIGAYGLKLIRTGDFNSDGKADLLICDNDKMGVLSIGKNDLTMEVIATYESNNRRGRLFDVAAGDLNFDNRVDLLVMDSRDNNFEIVSVLGGLDLKRATEWKVFEEKTFRQGSGRNIEPREIVIADLNNDKRNDIITLVHDRALVYLQDSGVDSGPVTDIAKSPSNGKQVTKQTPTKNKMPTSKAADSTVKDGGRFFKTETVDAARKAIAGIKADFNRDIVVESFSSIPESERVRFQQMDREGQDKFVAEWAGKRSKELGVNGVYVLICRQPSKLYVQATSDAVSRDAVEEMRSKLLSAFRSQQFDDGLMQAIETARKGLRKGS